MIASTLPSTLMEYKSDVKCTRCGHRFSVADGQPSPDGSYAPGVYAVWGTIFLAIGSLVVTSTNPGLGRYLGYVGLGISLLLFIKLPIAMHDCSEPAGLSPEPGNKCEKCGRLNPVRPWSM